MTQPATAPESTTAVPETNGAGVVKSYDERAAEVFGLPSGVKPADPAAPIVPAPDNLAQARADRRVALEKMKAEERGRVDAMAAIRERDQLRSELAAEREKSKAYERHVDPSKLSKEQFFALAEKNPDLSPRELGEWLRERMADPEAAATQAATRAIDPKLSALEKKLAEQAAVIDNFMSAQQRARDEAVERQAAHEFFAFTKQNAAVAPYSARFLEQHGPDEFYKVAQSAVRNVPPHGGAQAVLDEIEEQLTALSRIYQTTPQTGVPQRRQASPTPQAHAAAQAPTHVSNSLAQQRSSVVDEDSDWASLPFEERSARLFR